MPLALVHPEYEPPSKLAQAEAALEGFRKKLAEAEHTRAEIAASIPGLFELGGEAAADRERARLPQLEGKIARARENVQLAEQAVESHRERARAIELAQAKRRSEERAQGVVSTGGLVQVLLEDLVAAIAKLQEADRQFLISLGGWSNAAVTEQFHMSVYNRLEKAIYGLTGKSRPVALLGPKDVRDQGAHDFKFMTQDYIDMVLRNATQRAKE